MPSLTAATVDKQMSHRRIIEAKQRDLQDFARTQTQLASNNRAHENAAKKGVVNRRLRVNGEFLMEDTLSKKRENDAMANLTSYQQDVLADAIRQDRLDKQRMEREIQRICEQSEELKVLESKLKVGFMNKERALQLEESNAIKAADYVSERRIDQQMEEDRQNALREMTHREAQLRINSVNAKQQLEDQMMAKHTQEMYEAQKAADADKQMVHNVMRKIEEEDYHDYMEKNNKIKATKRAVEDYKLQREDLSRKHAAERKAEEDRIESYARQKGAREGAIKASQDAKKASEEERFRKIEEAMLVERAEKEEFESLRDLLWEEETEDRLRKQEQEKQEQRDATKLEMVEANRMQRRIKDEMATQRQAEEDELNKLQAEKFLKDAELDRQAAERRADERKSYKHRIATDKKTRTDAYADAKYQEEVLRQQYQEEENYKLRVIEAARQRLLKSHAQALGGFLPKGVLSKPEDLELLAQFDTDGKLDENELAAAKKAFMRYDADENGS